jgi:hypothetical protein
MRIHSCVPCDDAASARRWFLRQRDVYFDSMMLHVMKTAFGIAQE